MSKVSPGSEQWNIWGIGLCEQESRREEAAASRRRHHFATHTRNLFSHAPFCVRLVRTSMKAGSSSNAHSQPRQRQLYKPTRWPNEVHYISWMNYPSSLPSQLSLHLRPNPPLTHPQVQPPVIIRFIEDHSHPAYGQRGLFTSKKIPPRSHIIDYLGEVHCDDRLSSDYDLSLYRAEGISIGVDASRMGNEARFINDFRGVKLHPNAIFQEYRTSSGELRMSVWSGANIIKKGDEILVSYGKTSVSITIRVDDIRWFSQERLGGVLDVRRAVIPVDSWLPIFLAKAPDLRHITVSNGSIRYLVSERG